MNLQKEKQQPLDYDPWEFFYYWLGTKVKDNLNSHYTFEQVMETIYDGFPKNNGNSICTNLYPGISHSIFDMRKILFDFSYNYDTVQSEVKQGNNSRCEKINSSMGDINLKYQSMKGTCTGSGTDPYCTIFESKYGKYFPNGQPLKLTCPTAPEVEDPSSGLAVSHQENECLKELPSNKEYYEEFNKGMTNCDSSWSWTNQMKIALENHTDLNKYAKEIVGALCYILKKGESLDPEGEECKYLYYYIGDIVSSSPKSSELSGVIEKIYQEIKANKDDFKCINIYNDISETNFNRMKVIYDLSHDYDTVRGQPESPSYPCDESIGGYLDNFCGAYSNMSAVCNTKNREKYCTDFKQLINGSKYKDLLEQECEVERDPQATESIGPAHETDPNLTATIPSVVSAYTSVFDLAKNIFRGSSNRNNNNKRKKRRTIESDFDTLTEDDDNLTTEYSSTLGSTIGSMEEDASTIYDGRSPPTSRGRRRERNGRPGLQNISYGRM
ncbi:KIR protein [Plasmodium coatneyi]|uniref:KIR protein n=1 Tax=Plasmodium coatneyi TaxID=208452 RepID=A0A1B1E692_9APIC|nr:KIR protein [Plasmodium coatneyi]ANQ10531.1 KIR protein [Plasmodium coatneyi]